MRDDTIESVTKDVCFFFLIGPNHIVCSHYPCIPIAFIFNVALNSPYDFSVIYPQQNFSPLLTSPVFLFIHFHFNQFPI